MIWKACRLASALYCNFSEVLRSSRSSYPNSVASSRRKYNVHSLWHRLKQKFAKCPKLEVQDVWVLEPDLILTFQLEKPGTGSLEQGFVARVGVSILVTVLASQWVQCLSWRWHCCSLLLFWCCTSGQNTSAHKHSFLWIAGGLLEINRSMECNLQTVSGEILKEIWVTMALRMCPLTTCVYIANVTNIRRHHMLWLENKGERDATTFIPCKKRNSKIWAAWCG